LDTIEVYVPPRPEQGYDVENDSRTDDEEIQTPAEQAQTNTDDEEIQLSAFSSSEFHQWRVARTYQLNNGKNLDVM
jgi:hypothetical protein